MNTNLIFNNGANWIKRKPIARLFEPLPKMAEMRDEDKRCKPCVACGKIVESWIYSECGACMARHYEGESKPTISMPEFKIGDIVECLPDDAWCRPTDLKSLHDQIGKALAIVRIVQDSPWKCPIVEFGPKTHVWPLRALRHVETEPRIEDGWMKSDSNMPGHEFWHKSETCVLHNERGWTCSEHNARNMDSWPSLKAHIEKEMKCK